MGNLQRTTGDIKNEWPSIVANVKTNMAVAAYAGPNHWNDPDMLEVGNSDNGAGPVTDVENQSHFSLWAIASAPLIAGNNLFDVNMSAATKTILTNAEIIAIDQDAMGLQGVRIWENGGQSLWGKPLNANGTRAAVLFNEGDAAADMTLKFADLGLAPGTATVRDLQAHADLGSFKDAFTVNVASHGTATLKIVGNEPPRPKGSAYLSDQTPIYAANGLGPGRARHQQRRHRGGRRHADQDPRPDLRQGPRHRGARGHHLPPGRQVQPLQAQVGVDDIANGQGTVRFQVIADGEVLFDSMAVNGQSPATAIDVSLVGKRRLKLLVTNADDGTAQDRASWGDAKVECDP